MLDRESSFLCLMEEYITSYGSNKQRIYFVGIEEDNTYVVLVHMTERDQCFKSMAIVNN